jgi:hypothetical protein
VTAAGAFGSAGPAAAAAGCSRWGLMSKNPTSSIAAHTTANTAMTIPAMAPPDKVVVVTVAVELPSGGSTGAKVGGGLATGTGDVGDFAGASDVAGALVVGLAEGLDEGASPSTGAYVYT